MTHRRLSLRMLTLAGLVQGALILTMATLQFVHAQGSPSISITKDRDQMVVSGSTATFTITIRNTGDVTLTNVTVLDSQASNCARGTGELPDLAPEGSTSYVCVRPSVTSDFTNSATVTASDTLSATEVNATDTAFVNVINPDIEIAKTPDLQRIVSGSTVTFTITITNTGDVTLTNVTVSDAQARPCAREAGELPDLSPEGGSTSYECLLTNVTASFTNHATATGTPPIGDDVSATDTARVETTHPEIEITKTPDMQTVTSGTPVTFTIAVTNTGDVPLEDVTVSDAQAPPCARGIGELPDLAPEGGNTSYECTLASVTDGLINSAMASGSPPVGEDVTDADVAKVRLDETLTCPSDMIAYWKLDESSGNTYDDFYTGLDGQCAGQCPTPSSAGRINGCQVFDGNNTGIDVPVVPGDDSFNWGVDDSFSIEFWMQADGTCAGNEVVIGRDDSSTDLHWWAGCWTGGRAAFVLGDSQGEGDLEILVGVTDLTDGSWHHIVAVRDASANENRLYVDGTLEASGSASYSAGFDSSTAALNMGWINLSPYFRFDGEVDEVALYDRALSSDEVRRHRNEGLAGRWYCQGGTYPPIIVSTPVTEATSGQLYTYDVEAAGNPVPTYTLVVSPTGMMIDPVTGLISWTPTVAQEGSHDVEVEARNSEGATTQSFTIAVSQGTLCPTNMIAYWKLNETSGTTYEDFSGGHDGKCADAWNCPTPVTGHTNGGQEFDGSSTGIDVPADAAFDWGRYDSFSIEFWMQKDSACTGNEVVVGRDDSSTALHWWVGCENDGAAIFVLGDTVGTSGWVIGTTDLTDGAWHHVVAVRDGNAGEIRIYVDGVGSSTSASYSAGFDSSTAALNVGWINLSPYFQFDGVADEIALYGRALSEDEVRQHYNEWEPNPGYCINPEIAVVKAANPKAVYAEEWVTYTYTVTNPGDAPLSYVSLSDDKCGSASFQAGDDDHDNQLDPMEAETWIYRCQMRLGADITNTVTVTGTHYLSDTVDGTDTVFVDAIDPRIGIDKTADPTLIYAGDTVTYDYTVTNPGDDPLSSVSISDDKCSTLTHVGGDDNSNYKLDPGETWAYTCTTTLSTDTTNTAIVTGTDSAGSPVIKTDTAFVDVRDSTLTILKEASDEDTVFSFTLSYGSNTEPFQLKKGEWEQFSDLAPGSYTIAETLPSEWRLLNITCTNGVSLIAPHPPMVTVNLQSEQDVSCTFTNHENGAYLIYLPAILKN